MANEAQVFITGYVATDPAFMLLESGRPKLTLRVASTPRRFNRGTGEWADGPTSFVSVTCWRKLAENAALSLRKGEPVVVVGTLTVRQYDGKDGSPRTAVDVDATSIGHDLSRGVALFQRTKRASGGGTTGVADDGATTGTADGSAAEMAKDTAARTAGTADAEPASVAGPGEPAGVADHGEVVGVAGPGRAAEADDGADEVLDDDAVAALLAGEGGPREKTAARP